MGCIKMGIMVIALLAVSGCASTRNAQWDKNFSVLGNYHSGQAVWLDD